jgi:hypothetical protein
MNSITGGLPDPARWGYEVGYIRNNEKQYYTLILNAAIGGSWGG